MNHALLPLCHIAIHYIGFKLATFKATNETNESSVVITSNIFTSYNYTSYSYLDKRNIVKTSICQNK